jgi:hypothetical protein
MATTLDDNLLSTKLENKSQFQVYFDEIQKIGVELRNFPMQSAPMSQTSTAGERIKSHPRMSILDRNSLV